MLTKKQIDILQWCVDQADELIGYFGEEETDAVLDEIDERMLIAQLALKQLREESGTASKPKKRKRPK